MKTVPLFLLALFFAAAATSPAQVPAKPNILFILTDDQAVDTIAALGEWGCDTTRIKTPNLDRLAAGGVIFRNAYNMGAWTGAVCVSSRSMLNTGRFLWHARRAEMDKYRGECESGGMWAQRMKAAGYETYLTGKWHVETPAGALFDQTAHVRQGMPETVPSAYQRPLAYQVDTWLPWDESHGGYWAGGKHWSEVVADDAVSFVKRSSESKKPFFMYLAFNAPHDPRQSPKSYVDMYPADSVVVPHNFLPAHPFHEAMGLGPLTPKGLRDEVLAPFPRSEAAIRVHRGEYYALVSHLDAQIGRIIGALKASGLADNTVVLLTSDHGLAVGRHGLMGKQNMHEHSLRVPFLLSGPGIPSGHTIDARIYLQDAMATALELAGANASGVEFRSVLPLVRGERSTQYDAIYGAYMPDRQRAVVVGQDKLILYPSAGAVQLFNLSADPLELNDLSVLPDSLALQRRLFARLLELQRQTGDPTDLAKAFPRLL